MLKRCYAASVVLHALLAGIFALSAPAFREEEKAFDRPPVNIRLVYSGELAAQMRANSRYSGNRDGLTRDLYPGNLEAEAAEQDWQRTLDDMIEEHKERIGRLNETLDDFHDAVEGLKEALKRRADFYYEVVEDGDLSEYFRKEYAERNETTYSELFRLHGNFWLLKNKEKLSSVDHIVRQNTDAEGILHFDVEFAEDGSFRFTRFHMDPDFQDIEGEVERCYRDVMEAMPRRFVPPGEAGLKAPYELSYFAVNSFYND